MNRPFHFLLMEHHRTQATSVVRVILGVDRSFGSRGLGSRGGRPATGSDCGIGGSGSGGREGGGD
eukprot:2793184-Prymnesium_polylepis.1